MDRLHILETERLLLRQWRSSDLPAFAALNRDPEVMHYLPSALSAADSDRLAQRCAALIAERGWGLWAVEDRADACFIGFIGLHIPAAELPFPPCVEIGWRLARAWWGRGLATEGARAALDFAFRRLHLPEVVGFTSLANRRSQAVMQRDALTFHHPSLPLEHWLSLHCLYRAHPASGVIPR